MSAPRTIGPYELQDELGRGGMGAVYLARHAQLGYEVALKLLLAESTRDPRRRARFAREVETLRALEHPHLVEVLDAGEHAGLPWLAMRYVPGETLDERLKRQGPLPVPEVLRLGEELGAALGAAHAAGVIHRDVKPDNVLVRASDGRFLLTDFGLAREVELAESRRLSLTGVVQGTPGFWAPEQATGEETGPWTDVYGLGATLYAALTGEPPIRGEGFLEVVKATAARSPDPPGRFRADLPPALEAAVLRALAKAPGERPSSVEALVAALSAADVPAGWQRRLVAPLLGLVVGLALAVVALLAVGRPAPSTAEPGEPRTAEPTATAPSPEAAQASLLKEVARLQRAGRHPDAIALLEAAPPSAEVQFLLGQAYQRGVGTEADPARALAHYRQSAALGHARALSQLGFMHMRGLGVPQDAARARALFAQAAERGATSAMINLAVMFARALGGPPDPAGAVAWLERAFQAGEPKAALELGRAYVMGRTVKRDYVAARRWLQAASERGVPEAGYLLSKLLHSGKGGARDRAEALRLLKRSASQGWPAAQYLLGDRHATGRGVPVDLVEAARLWTRAAERGSSLAQHALWRAYLAGRGVTRDLARARGYLEQAAQAELPRSLLELAQSLWRGSNGFRTDRDRAQRLVDRLVPILAPAARKGDAQALLMLGTVAEMGFGRTPNPKAAADCYRQAAERGEVTAMHRYASLLFLGKGIPRDRRAAAQWVERAARAGYPPSMERYAACLAKGIGVARDLAAAGRWLKRAAQRGNVQALYSLGLYHETDDPQKPRDHARALSHFRRAAELGHVDAMLQLCDACLGNQGYPVDLREARRWLEAARQKARSPQRRATVERLEAALRQRGG